MSQRIFDRILVVLWLGLCLAAAFRIYSYYHPDEFGQIVAFYLLKLGEVDAKDLPWEYHEKMRPWLQPAFYYLILYPLHATLGFRHLLFERLTLLVQFALLALTLPLFLRMVRPASDGEYSATAATPSDWPARLATLYWATLWFVPFMLVRHSSEAFATILMVPALYCWQRAGSARATRALALALAAGLFAGLSSWVRFQLGIFWATLFPLALVYDLVGGRALRRYAAAFGGIAVALLFALTVDRWGYGSWQFAPWNYFHQNIVKGASAGFGVEPWHWYFKQATDYMVTPFFLLILARAIWLARKDAFLGPLAAGLVAFFALHSAVGHKEIRFLLPMILPVALLFFHMYRRPNGTAANGQPGGTVDRPLAHRLWSGALVLHWSLSIAINILAFCFTYYVRGIREKYQINQELWQVPPGTHVISHSFIYGHQDEIHEPGVEVSPGWMEGWIRPPVRLLYMRTEKHAAACRRHPEGLVLHSMNEEIPAELKAKLERVPESNLMVDLPFETTSYFPAYWLRAKYPEYYRDHWRYHLVRCDKYLEFLEARR